MGFFCVFVCLFGWSFLSYKTCYVRQCKHFMLYVYLRVKICRYDVTVSVYTDV